MPWTRQLRRAVAAAGSTAGLVGELDDFTDADLLVLADVPFAMLLATAEEEAVGARHDCLGLEHISCAALRLLGNTDALMAARVALASLPSPAPGLINVRRLHRRRVAARDDAAGPRPRGETTHA